MSIIKNFFGGIPLKDCLLKNPYRTKRSILNSEFIKKGWLAAFKNESYEEVGARLENTNKIMNNYRKSNLKRAKFRKAGFIGLGIMLAGVLIANRNNETRTAINESNANKNFNFEFVNPNNTQDSTKLSNSNQLVIEEEVPEQEQVYTVRKGDCIWSIAKNNKPKNVSIDAYEEELIKLNVANGLDTTGYSNGFIKILPDQELILPDNSLFETQV